LRKTAWLAALAAAILPILLYLPSLSYGFIFDDRPLLIENPVVQSPRGVAEIFTTDLDPQARLQEAPSTNYLRPLFLALAAGIYQLSGESPFGWHLAAVLLHGLLGGLAFWLLRRELGIAAGLLAALLFSFHPAHVQSVAWISGMQDLLVAVFALLAYMAYRSSAGKAAPGAGALALLGMAYALALLAKEPAIGLLLLVAAEMALGGMAGRGEEKAEGRRPWAELAVLVALTGAYFAYRAAVIGSIAHPFPTAPAMPEALASVPPAIFAYLRDLFWPVGLFLLHPARPVSSWSSPAALAGIAGLAVVGALAFWAAWRRPVLIRPFLFFGAWLAPALALWAINPEWMVMDRYLLLPSLALGWALALIFGERLPAGERWGLAQGGHGGPPLHQGYRGRVPMVAAVALIAVFAALSLQGMRDFRDEDVFWNAAIEADPGSSTAFTEWAKRRSEAGDLEAAAGALEKAIGLDPQAQLPRLRRALLALRGGQPAAAAAELEQLTERNPGYLPAWRNLVVAQDRAGNAAAARRALERALALFPEDALLWTHQAVVLRAQGRREEALAAIRRAAALDPRDPALALREAMLLAELGRAEEARQAARRGLAMGPTEAISGQLEKMAR
jgi:tetratricopeptide (TPR) repeat protein